MPFLFFNVHEFTLRKVKWRLSSRRDWLHLVYSTGMSECELCEQISGKSKPSLSELNDSRAPRKITKVGKILLGVAGASFVGVFAVTTPFLLPAVRKVCLPYVPATTTQVKNVLQILHGRKGTLVDLGSGDGRIVINCAQAGFQATGVDLNPWLTYYARVSAWRAGVSSNTQFHTRDLWKVDLSKYDNIVIFGVEQMMAQLEDKLKNEMKRDACIAVCRFRLPNSSPVTEIDKGIDTVWLYDHKSLGVP